VGFLDSFSEFRTLMSPLPSLSHCIQSVSSMAGSPKNTSPPLSSRDLRDLWTAPRLWVDIWPYSAT